MYKRLSAASMGPGRLTGMNADRNGPQSPPWLGFNGARSGIRSWYGASMGPGRLTGMNDFNPPEEAS